MSRGTPKPLSGFPEFLPAQREVERQVVEALSRTFELHGFANIETRAVEPLDQLLRKGDTSKEVYLLRRLQESEEEGRSANGVGLGLHFDLTVPFARYVLENAGKLEFPFRRYQIQKVWRGERPQDGRFREFVQADIDIVGQGELPFHHDVEVTRVMLHALGTLTRPDSIGLPGFTLQVNNRKLIQGFYLGLGISEDGGGVESTMRVIDKLDKMPEAKIRELLRDEAGLDDEQVDQCLALAAISTEDESFADQVRALGVTHTLLDEGLDELSALVRACAPLADDRVRIRAELKIARGLDYYT
ncbi:MAG TPA: ATP phosphoribosyltransferase regulatory subunit, partial [Nocardioides sp.]